MYHQLLSVDWDCVGGVCVLTVPVDLIMRERRPLWRRLWMKMSRLSVQRWGLLLRRLILWGMLFAWFLCYSGIIADASADTDWIYVRPLSLVSTNTHLPGNRGRGRPENSSILLEKLFRKDRHFDLGRGCDRPASNRWLPGRACGPAFGRGRPTSPLFLERKLFN